VDMRLLDQIIIVLNATRGRSGKCESRMPCLIQQIRLLLILLGILFLYTAFCLLNSAINTLHLHYSASVIETTVQKHSASLEGNWQLDWCNLERRPIITILMMVSGYLDRKVYPSRRINVTADLCWGST